uniref:HECT domain-containing protein n=1 Tax=Maylandia zebra TaxID=106582 RepID=A0A3P9DGL5_9CICH
MLDYLANAGCLRPMRSLRDRDLLVHDIVMFQVIHRVQGPFQRFCEGLKTLGVLEKMRRHPDSFRPLFCYEPHMLTADQVDDLFTFIYLQKEATEELLRRQLLPSGETISKMQKILAFATGATAVPPIGFSPAPSIELPLHVSYQLFKEKFDFKIQSTERRHSTDSYVGHAGLKNALKRDNS